MWYVLHFKNLHSDDRWLIPNICITCWVMSWWDVTTPFSTRSSSFVSIFANNCYKLPGVSHVMIIKKCVFMDFILLLTNYQKYYFFIFLQFYLFFWKYLLKLQSAIKNNEIFNFIYVFLKKLNFFRLHSNLPLVAWDCKIIFLQKILEIVFL